MDGWLTNGKDMRRKFTEGPALVLLNRVAIVERANLFVRIHCYQYVGHIGLRRKRKERHSYIYIEDNKKCARYRSSVTHINLIFKISRLEVVQQRGLVEEHELTCKCIKFRLD